MRRTRPKRFCKTCGSLLSKNCSGDFCNRHRDRTGAKNSFFGRSHDPKTIEDMKEKTRQASKDLWKDPAYRQKVTTAVSKPRREGFREEQSARITQWFTDNPEQRGLRRISMRANWKEGRIQPQTISRSNTSKAEKVFFADVSEIAPDAVVKKPIKLNGRWVTPDVLIPRTMNVFEFYGDFWHANPYRFEGQDIVHHGVTASEIWKRDEEREQRLIDAGYSVHIVWQSGYKKYRQEILNNISHVLNWEE